MSLKNVLKDVGQWISRLFKKLLPAVKRAVDTAVKVTSAIKDFDTTNSGVVDIITKIIPGDTDDKVVAKVREKLPEVMLQLKLIDTTLNLTDPQEIVAAGIKTIQQMSGDYRSATLNSISIVLSMVAADGKLDWNDAVYLVKWYYDNVDNEDVDTSLDSDGDGVPDKEE